MGAGVTGTRRGMAASEPIAPAADDPDARVAEHRMSATSCPRSRAVRRDDAWNTHHRSEAPLQRADRNFAELLQELRVLLTGVQILLGFLLTLAFNPGFADLDAFRHGVYLVTLLSAAVSSALLVGPVAVHRLLFQYGRKRQLVTVGHRLALAALIGLGTTLAAALLLVLDIAVGRTAAVVLTGGLVVGIGLLWCVVPLLMFRATHPAGES